MRLALLGATAVAAVAISGCGEGLFITADDEVQLGLGVDSQIEQEYIIVSESDPVAQWARELVAGLSQGSLEFRDPMEFGGYKVDVIYDDSLVNAFAAPGGFTYISTGLILASESCAEIAGVMGHELAHVTERHGVEALEKAMGITTLVNLLLGEDSLGSQAAQLVWGFVQNTEFSREDESESDAVGLQIAHNAGYNPYALAGFFDKLLALGGETSDIEQFFSSHPPSAERSAQVRTDIETRYPGVWTDAPGPGHACQGTTLTFEQVRAAITQKLIVAKPGTGQGPPPEPAP